MLIYRVLMNKFTRTYPENTESVTSTCRRNTWPTQLRQYELRKHQVHFRLSPIQIPQILGISPCHSKFSFPLTTRTICDYMKSNRLSCRVSIFSLCAPDHLQLLRNNRGEKIHPMVGEGGGYLTRFFKWRSSFEKGIGHIYIYTAFFPPALKQKSHFKFMAYVTPGRAQNTCNRHGC